MTSTAMHAASETTLIRFRDYRCPTCAWLLFRAHLLPGACVQVKCRGCRQVVTIRIEEDA
jgi:phage FluMu protein Com